MKAVLLACLLWVLVARGVDFSQITDAQTLDAFIRQRGTKVYQFLGKGNQTWVSEEKMIELPVVCDQELSSEQLSRLVEQSKDIMEEWCKAKGSPMESAKAQFTNMPFLTPPQFAQFYNYIWHNHPHTDRDQQQFFGEEDTKDTQHQLEMVRQVNFDPQGQIEEVGWLSFWVYTCAPDHRQPPLASYLSLVDLRNHRSPHLDKKYLKYQKARLSKKGSFRLALLPRRAL